MNPLPASAATSCLAPTAEPWHSALLGGTHQDMPKGPMANRQPGRVAITSGYGPHSSKDCRQIIVKAEDVLVAVNYNIVC